MTCYIQCPPGLCPGTDSLPDEVCSHVRLFADDTALYPTLESEDDSLTLQNDLNILSAWETRWDMGFNPSKCQVVHVTGSKKPVKRDHIMHRQVLESVTSARYLGVDISSSLLVFPPASLSMAQRNAPFLWRHAFFSMPCPFSKTT